MTASECTHTPSSTGTSMRTEMSRNPQWQSQRGPAKGGSSIAQPTTSTTTSNFCQNVQRMLYADEGMPIHEAQYYRDWASPAEVLQLRTICTDLANKHKNETAALRRELEELRGNHNALLVEAEDARRLHQVCVKAESEHTKARREYSKWEGEREVLRLQLQRLSLDNQRLRQMVARREQGKAVTQRCDHAETQRNVHPQTHHQQLPGLVTSSGSSELRLFTSGATATISSTIPTPSFTSSSLPRNGVESGVTPQDSQQRGHRSQTQSIESTNGVADSGSAPRDEVACGSNGFDSNNRWGSEPRTGWGGDRSSACDPLSCMREQLRLMEEFNRATTAYAELEARMHFAQTLWDMSTAREAQRSLMLSAEGDRLRSQVNHWRSIAEDALGKLEVSSTQLRDCRDELHATQQKLQAAAAATAAAVTAVRKESEETVTQLKLSHAAELSQAHTQLQKALDDNIRSRETLQRALKETQKQAEAQKAQLVSDFVAAEQRAAEATRAKCESDAALQEAAAQHASACRRLERELLIERSAGRRCVEEKTQQAGELESLRDSCMTLEGRLRDTEVELELVTGRLHDALEKLALSAKIEEELGSTRLRAEEAERELKEQQKHYEETQQLHLAAYAKLQRESDADVTRLERDVRKYRHRCETTKVRLAAALKGMTDWSRVREEPQSATAADCEESNEGRKTAAAEVLRADVVSLLKQSTAIAGTLARTIQRGAGAP